MTDPLYPTAENFVVNPMTSNLSAGGFGITNLNTLGMTGSGAITGVVTINGSAYPPLTLIAKNYSWLYSSVASQIVYSGYGAQQNSVSWETVVYNSPTNPVSLQPYTWASGTVPNSAFVIPLTGVYRFTVNLMGNLNQNGSFSCGICPNGSITAGGNMTWNRTTAPAPVGVYIYQQPLNPYCVTIVNLASGTPVVIAGLDADATGYGITIGGVIGNVNLISTFQIEYLG